MQPIGLVADAFAEGGLPLAGGPLRFLGGILLERGPYAVLRRRYLTARDCEEARDPELRSWVERLVAKRSIAWPWPLHQRPFLIMGIVNVTPDSFSDGGQFQTVEEALSHARALIAGGADILDVGGESTRPGADETPLAAERLRVMPVLTALREESVLLSLDTRKAALMAEANAVGIDMVNDISALGRDPSSIATLTSQSCAVVLVHSRGEPGTMQQNPHYDHAILDIYDALEERIRVVEAAGIARGRLIVDPGIGFGKTAEHNLELMRSLSLFHGLGTPIVLGVSRKSVVGTVTGVRVPAERVFGSLGMGLAAVAQGVQILRVHDVAPTRQALAAWSAATLGESCALAEDA